MNALWAWGWEHNPELDTDTLYDEKGIPVARVTPLRGRFMTSSEWWLPRYFADREEAKKTVYAAVVWRLYRVRVEEYANGAVRELETHSISR